MHVAKIEVLLNYYVIASGNNGVNKLDENHFVFSA